MGYKEERRNCESENRKATGHLIEEGTGSVKLEETDSNIISKTQYPYINPINDHFIP